MKIYTIGRDPSCKISFNNEQVSRQHAILRVHNFGKMEIVDKSTNGTFINNVHIASNVPVPVRRKDVISFAKTCQLDWTLVEDPLRKYRLIFAGILAAIVIIAGCIFLSYACDNSDVSTEEENASANMQDKKQESKDDMNKSKESNSKSNVSETSSSDSSTDKIDSTKRSTKAWVKEEIRRRTQAVATKPVKKVNTNSNVIEPKVNTEQKSTKSNSIIIG